MKKSQKSTPHTPCQHQECFTVREVASKLKCSADHVLRLLLVGDLRAYDIGVKRGSSRHSWRIPGAYLEEFLASRDQGRPIELAPRHRAIEGQRETIEFI